MNTRKYRSVLAAAVAPLVLFAVAGGAQTPSWVIRNARVHTLSKAGTLERASIVVQDGKIAAVGTAVRAPAGAQVIEGTGLEVYPGMVNAWSNIGLTEISAVDVTNDYNEQGNYKPQLLAFSAINAASDHIPVARVNGVTSSLSAPAGGVIAGQPVLIHLDGWTVDEMALLKSAGMVMNYPSLEGGRRRFGGMGAPRQPTSFAETRRNYETAVRELSEWLQKARHYAFARQSNPQTETDRQLEALVPVVSGRSTVFMSADTARDIRNAVEFGKKEKLRIVIQGGRESARVADLLSKENVPVILGSIVELPTREDDPYDARFTVARDLAKAGVKFALTSPSSSEVRNLPYEAGFAQAYGLAHAEALRAVTLAPAEILGVADRIGSIEPGKVADLVVTDGDLLELRTQVKRLFIAGRDVQLDTRHTRLYKQYLARP
jgi:imidazolonepropionase-like amidohydrolase